MGLTHKTETILDDLFSKFAVEPKEKKREEDDDEKEKDDKDKKEE